MNRRRFLPSVVGLESRIAMSNARPVHLAAVAPAYAATGRYPDAYRQELHSFYQAKAASGSAPVLFLGDSITLLWNSTTGEVPGTAAWDSTFAPIHADNFGVLGDQTQNLLYRINDGELAARPKVAVVGIGLNDLLIGGKKPPAVAAGVSSVVAEIRRDSPRTQILLLGLTPVAYGSGFAATEAQVNTRIAKVAQQRNVTYLDPGEKFLQADGTLLPGVLRDYIHPSALGYEILAAQLIGPVKTALRR